jgi:hypothetical protein
MTSANSYARDAKAVKQTRTFSVAALALVLLFTDNSCDVKLTYGTQWQGDSSQCINAPADATIQTIGGDVGGLDQEWGKVTPSDYEGKNGCDKAYILDYLMPKYGTNLNPGWTWAWIHVASRMTGVDEAKCKEMWTSLKVYAYWTFQGVNHQEQLKESYRKGEWQSGTCLFGLPDNIWMSSAYVRVRAATQHGWGLAQVQSHYSYFVTNNFPLP